MEAHFIYLKNWLEKKVLVLAGPCLDAAFGVAILETESEEKAKEIMQNDPAVKGRVMTAELHPFRISLMQSR